MKSVENKRRELFEAAFKLRHKPTFPAIELSRDSGTGYKYNPAHIEWVVWNAALNAIVIELPALIGDENGGCNHDAAIHDEAVNECRESIELLNLGIKVK